MADTQASEGLKVQRWNAAYHREYLQGNRFSPYMGTKSNALIQVQEELTKKPGDSVTFALVNKLNGNGVTGDATLEGNEESLISRSFKVTVEKARNAVRVSESQEQFSAIPLRNAAREQLMDWSMEHTRDKVIEALKSINGVNYSTASEAQKDAWLVDNSDRVLFGDSKGNGSYTDHSADLATVTAAMTMDTSIASLMKRMALAASPKVRPIRVKGMDKRFFVCFMGPEAFRDLKADSVMTQAQREVSIRMQNNKLFKGGDLEYDGIIFHEVDDMTAIGTVGASSANVVPVHLCGAQAVSAAYASRWNSRTEEFDYGDKHGVAIDSIYEIKKTIFGSGAGDTDDLKDHGVVTAYVGGAAD